MELGEREYWHGTKAQSAVCIVCEGFRIDPEFGIFGRTGSFREAIYLTKSLETARGFGEYIARCALSTGTRILRLDGAYDTKTVQYLRREFGKEVLSPRFSKVLPANKHLTKKELISLLNFVFSKAEKERAKEREWLNWQGNLTRIREQLRRHAFHAVGRVDDIHGALRRPYHVWGPDRTGAPCHLRCENKEPPIMLRRVCATLLAAGLLSAGPETKANEPMLTTQPKHTNQLIHATSPYLLQHAHNPVNWHEWGAEALQKAVKEDKPIFLSIGYSACHWCHVMEHESFENGDVARVLNEHFVAIKVDREERPDIDEIYMHVTVSMTGHGGWPMSLFLTPQRLPIYAGTYFPRQQFKTLCERIAEKWETQRDELTQSAARFRAQLEQWAAGPDQITEVLGTETIARTARTLARYFDPVRGGMGRGNKFPPSMAMDLMLRVHARTGDATLLAPVKTTLDRMANGGIYDHLGGGICRYATDPDWLVPHFEKMLYDQALVSAIFLDAYQVTKKGLYAQRAMEILDYVIVDLQSPEGGFYSTRDADSEGLEGKYYIWTVEQVREVLGDEDAELFGAYYDVTAQGNWEERRGHAPPGPKNILNIQRDAEVVAKLYGLKVEELNRRLAAMRAKMLAARQQRVPPALDDKCLSGWNGLMIAGLAKGARVLDEPKYAKAAASAADFVLTRMRQDGRLLRTYRNGQARLTGYLSDYAFMIEGLLSLYEATFDPRWLDEAVALNEVVIRHYFDAVGGGFFFTADDAEQLVVRTKSPRDGAIPSGNSVQATNLLRLAVLKDRKDYRDKAASVFGAFGAEAANSPGAFERLFSALDWYHHGAKEIAIIGDPNAADTKALLDAVYARYLPNKVVVLGRGSAKEASAAGLPLLRSRGMIDGKATAFVCENYACKRPVTEPAELAKLLADKEQGLPPP